jgi:putative thioredoxin
VAIDVVDATFETEVMKRSAETPVVVDLWAEWCGPCRSLGPILEKVIDETEGRVVLAKVDVDNNRQIAEAFRVQSIPAVYAVKDGKVVDGFIGAQGEAAVRAFVDQLQPSEEQTEIQRLLAVGDEPSLRQVLELDPPNEDAIVALAELCAKDGRTDEALQLLDRVPESAATRRVAALARNGQEFAGGDVTDKLDALLDQVKDDDAARQEYLDLLELLGADDPRTADYRKQLTARLF